MEITKAHVEEFAHDELVKHGLAEKGWTFAWNNRKCIGLCTYHDKTIHMSSLMFPGLSPWEIKDTILHEIAHALVGSSVDSHGWEWRRTAISIGSSGSRCGTVDNSKVESPYIGVCSAGHVHNAFRMTKGIKYGWIVCLRDGCNRRPIVWTKTAKKVPAGAIEITIDLAG